MSDWAIRDEFGRTEEDIVDEWWEEEQVRREQEAERNRQRELEWEEEDRAPERYRDTPRKIP